MSVKKSFRNNYPLTTCKITKKGIEAFENYVKAISGYLNTGRGE
ncbi:MAG: transcriptional regulator [Bacteroidetes bacterium]|nr:transcriptional regulator [Bacteroidota bacterium]